MHLYLAEFNVDCLRQHVFPALFLIFEMAATNAQQSSSTVLSDTKL